MYILPEQSKSEKGMSVFGGDSWGREANYRKRRLDDFIIQEISDKSNDNYNNTNGSSQSSSYKKLANGKYACLVCPQNPVLDTPLMLSMHMKGSRHFAAESRLKERELSRQSEINKRIALSGNSIPAGSTQQYNFVSKPLTQRTRKAVSEALGANSAQQSTIHKTNTVKCTGNPTTNASSLTYDTNNIVEIVADKQASQQFDYKEQVPMQQQLDYKERREKELKFKAAGWKRDGFGGWYKDENVEFDSDEEDPNVCFA